MTIKEAIKVAFGISDQLQRDLAEERKRDAAEYCDRFSNHFPAGRPRCGYCGRCSACGEKHRLYRNTRGQSLCPKDL